jgi:NAD+ diphosphatase
MAGSPLFAAVPPLEASAAVGYAGNRIDRRSEHRPADAIAVALRDPAARLYLFRADGILSRGRDPLFTVAEALAYGADLAGVVLLGWRGAAPELAAALPAEAAVDQGRISIADLRSLATGALLSPEHLGALAQARALLNWHARHRFCSVCGGESVIANGGLRRDCPRCGAEHFPRTDPVVIMLTVDLAGDRILLARQRHFPPGMHSALAGFMEPGETIEQAVRRETMEEAGIGVGRVRYHASQPWPFPASLMIGCHAEALNLEIVRDTAELEAARWFPRPEVVAMLAGAHPDGLTAPNPVAIAHHLIAAWAGEPAPA